MAILYSHAHDAEGNRRSVREIDAPRPYRCGDCENEMIAKRGQVRRWHFAHRAKVVCVPKADPDNMLHRVAQDLIVKSFNECVKNGTPYEIVYRCGGVPGRQIDVEFCSGELVVCKNALKENLAQPGGTIHQEKVVVSGTRSDIVVEMPGHEPFIIEVVNTHDLEDETRRLYRESRYRVVIREVTWEDVEEISIEFRVDRSLNISDWECADCTERKLEQQRRAVEALEREKQRVETLNRRKRVIDAAAARLVRRPRPSPIFKPWYEVYKKNWMLFTSPVKMFPRVQRMVFANAVILTEMGFEQQNPDKLHLFRFCIRRSSRVFIYGDLGGSEDVPIYRDTSVMLYAPDLNDSELEEYAVNVFGKKLQEAGASVRVGFEAHMDFESRHVDPTMHVDMRLVSPIISDASIREMETQRQERVRQEEEERGRNRQDRQDAHPDWSKFNEWVRRGGGVS